MLDFNLLKKMPSVLDLENALKLINNILNSVPSYKNKPASSCKTLISTVISNDDLRKNLLKVLNYIETYENYK